MLHRRTFLTTILLGSAAASLAATADTAWAQPREMQAGSMGSGSGTMGAGSGTMGSGAGSMGAGSGSMGSGTGSMNRAGARSGGRRRRRRRRQRHAM